MLGKLIVLLASPPGHPTFFSPSRALKVEPPRCRYTINPLASRSGGFSFGGHGVHWFRGGEQGFPATWIWLFVHTRPPCTLFPKRLTCRSARSEEGALPHLLWFRHPFTPMQRTPLESRALESAARKKRHPAYTPRVWVPACQRGTGVVVEGSGGTRLHDE
jgi:hypothetical protein